jgi:hypothetical protein
MSGAGSGWGKAKANPREMAAGTAVMFVALAAFPKLARWPAGLGRRGMAIYIASNAAFVFAIHTWLIPYFKRMAEQHERAREELRHELGREPSDEELFARLGIACER